MKILRILLLALLVAPPALAQVAPVTVYQGKDESGSAAGITLSGVNNTGGNLMVCHVAWRNNSSQTLNAITFNSTSFFANEIGTQLNSGGGSVRSFYFNGTMATASVIVTMSAAVPTIQAACAVYSGANATPIGNVQTSTGTGTSTTTAANTGADDDDFIDDVFVVRTSPGTITVGADQTERASQATASTLHLRTSDQDGAISGDTMSWSWVSSQSFAHKAVVIESSGGGGGASNALRAMHHLKMGQQ